jgi:hypothetical protein
VAPTKPTKKIEIDAARYSAFLNGAYHADREGVLDRRHRWMMFLVIALGTSSVVTMFGRSMSPYIGVATALIGAIDLAFGLSVRARNHAYLRKEYFRIASGLANGKCTAEDAEAKMMELAAEEEPVFKAAHSLAANWAMKAVYGNTKAAPCKVGWFRRLFRHWFMMTEVDFTS